MKPPIPLPYAAQQAITTPAAWSSKTLALQTLTPLYGGGVEARKQGPRNEPIRAPSIRGQLRFWWRARHARSYDSTVALFEAERALWGGTGRLPSQVTRARVQLRIEVAPASVHTDTSTVDFRHLDGYVLWPAAVPNDLARWREGIKFWLTVRYLTGDEATVKEALRDWILFGGVGGRARRGCGALGLTEAADRQWLGLPQTPAQLARLAGAQGALNPATGARLVTLAGATACFGVRQAMSGAMSAWRTAHGWLKEFRQGAAARVDTATCGDFARERPNYANGGRGPADRPGRSRWPEPDKIRSAFRTPRTGWAHPPRTGIGNAPAWPRASFGLPIQVKFQSNPRPDKTYPGPEPQGPGAHGIHKLMWRIGPNGARIERLPSPLIVKPMQLLSGDVIPLALWLQRSLPTGAEVGLETGATLGATAPFDTLRGPGEPDYFTPLAGKATTQEAFLGWLASRPGIGRQTL